MGLTVAGLEGLGLELAAVRAPAVFSATTLRSIEIAWAAGNAEQEDLQWLSTRELTVERERWQSGSRAITAGRHAQVRFPTGPTIDRDLQRLAPQIGLDSPALIAGENMTEHELIGPAAAAEDDTIPPAAVEK